MPVMFIVRTNSPLDEQWQQRDKDMFLAAGRKPERSSAGSDGEDKWREHIWSCKEFGDAQRLRRLLESVGGVTAFIREHVSSCY